MISYKQSSPGPWDNYILDIYQNSENTKRISFLCGKGADKGRVPGIVKRHVKM